MKYILAYIAVSVLASLFIGRFIYVGHADEDGGPGPEAGKKGREKTAVPSEEKFEKVSRD